MKNKERKKITPKRMLIEFVAVLLFLVLFLLITRHIRLPGINSVVDNVVSNENFAELVSDIEDESLISNTYE